MEQTNKKKHFLKDNGQECEQKKNKNDLHLLRKICKCAPCQIRRKKNRKQMKSVFFFSIRINNVFSQLI